MSLWTHITGTVRVDSFLEYAKTKKQIEDILGKPAYFESPEDWDSCKLPLGSEGSVEYKIIQSGEEKTQTNKNGKVSVSSTNLAAFVVCFWGDLRDYELDDKIDEVEKWFKEFVLSEGLLIRSAVLEVECFDEKVIFHYEKDFRNNQAKVVKTNIKN